MLVVSPAVRDAIVAHCRAALPNEACGLLSAPGVGEPCRFHPIPNAEPSPTRFVLDPVAQLAAEIAIDDDGEQVVAIVHSHPTGDNAPSSVDVDDATRFDPFATLLHVVVSPASGSIRAFRIVDGAVEEVGL